jgi:hypothetical protein
MLEGWFWADFGRVLDEFFGRIWQKYRIGWGIVLGFGGEFEKF